VGQQISEATYKSRDAANNRVFVVTVPATSQDPASELFISPLATGRWITWGPDFDR
jgi:hypothetical protein